MSPLLISRPSPLFSRRLAFRHTNVRSSSSAPSLIPPFVSFFPEPCGSGVGNLVIIFDCILQTVDKKVPKKLMNEKEIIGASHKWVATLKNGVMCLQDDLDLSASDINPKRISLPPFITLPHCQTQVVTNMAMSCSSPEEDDCCVAVKFLGSQLSLCRPAQRDSKWINIEIKNSSFLSSPIMFSKKDGMFRIPCSGGHLIESWDLHKHNKSKLQKVRFRNLPKLTKAKWEILESCCRSEHLVETEEGETFMVKWYRKKTRGLYIMRTIGMMVFKLDEQGNAVYTQDIGDVTIFISKSQPFCVSGPSRYSFCLFPNNVYFQDYDEYGSVDIGTPLFEEYMVISQNSINPVPFYFPPQITEYSYSPHV